MMERGGDEVQSAPRARRGRDKGRLFSSDHRGPIDSWREKRITVVWQKRKKERRGRLPQKKGRGNITAAIPEIFSETDHRRLQ